MTERIVIVSDIQYPFHNRRALKNIVSFIGDYRPDRVVQIGDALDYPTPSRWNKGTKDEFQQQVMKESEGFVRDFIEPLRGVYDGPVGFLEGNHDERPRKYLAQQAPALAEFSDVFHFKTLCRFDDFGIDLLPPFYDIAPGWVAIHGHELKGMSQVAGSTALGHARKIGKSVVMGHVHRLAIKHQSVGIGRNIRPVWGFETGHVMAPEKAQYLNGGPANWASGFGILYADKYEASPSLVPISGDGSFVVEGERYGQLKRGPRGQFAQKDAA
jgi:UDP-2,3-diacylglucosamine pyrophosphatase LpxH